MEWIAVARVLEQIATHLELKEENPFRVRAFRSAARAMRSMTEAPAEALASGSLAATKGIGPATVAIVRDLVETGRSEMLEQLREDVPQGLLEMIGVAGLGMARIRAIHRKLGVESLAELEAAARDGRLAGLAGFGPKTVENLLKAIARKRRVVGLRLPHHAAEEADLLRMALGRLPGVSEVIIAGEVRRRSELVRELVVVAVSDSPAEDLFARLARVPGLDEIAGEDERRATLRTAGDMSARVIVTPPRNLGGVLLEATGSAEHVAALAAHAAGLGMSFHAAALWRGSTFIPTPDEAALYRALGLDDIPPELREGLDEIALAASGRLPVLVERADLAGFLHCHSRYSDGSIDIEPLALACRDAGYSYVGLTDHSRSAAYAGGLAPDRIREQWREIDAVNARLEGVRVLKGIESDILADGRLDYEDELLAGFDFVIGSIHSRFAMTEAEMTTRLLRAMDNPYLTILGHPTGRLLLSRDPYPLDLDAVFARAAARGVALEINADPHRLDLDWRLVRRAREHGVMISLGADAHNRAGLDYVEQGMGIARKGGLTRDALLNTRSAVDFLAFARARRIR